MGVIQPILLNYMGRALTNLNLDADAILYYQKLLQLFPKSNYGDDALYRMGRIYSLRGDFINATSYFKRVSTDYPYGDKLPDALWELGLIQYRSTDYSSAKNTFSNYASSYKGTSLEEKGLFWQAKCHQKLGENDKQLKSELNEPYTDYLYYLYYPYGYKELVQKYSAQYNLDPLFTLAVMRQESLFMSDAGSYAGAQGLMQIMPSTGEGIAKQIGISNYTVNILLDPETNIRMGTFYLRQQLDNFGQNEFYCVGAYNGGPSRMSGWVSERGNMDIDEFIESISYEQSREYVKIVMGNYYFYQMLYD